MSVCVIGCTTPCPPVGSQGTRPTKAPDSDCSWRDRHRPGVGLASRLAPASRAPRLRDWAALTRPAVGAPVARSPPRRPPAYQADSDWSRSVARDHRGPPWTRTTPGIAVAGPRWPGPVRGPAFPASPAPGRLDQAVVSSTPAGAGVPGGPGRSMSPSWRVPGPVTGATVRKMRIMQTLLLLFRSSLPGPGPGGTGERIDGGPL